MKRKTRFGSDDLRWLKAEAEAVHRGLQQLSQHLLAANLAHTGSNMYDGSVRRVSDRLCCRLNALDELFHYEELRA